MKTMKQTVAVAILKVLRPIAQLLLRFEISHSEFAELAKRAYVDAAFNHFSIPNRKQTFSRVSVLTGLSRKEVVRIASIEPDHEPETKGPLNRATRVIGGWLKDPEFLDNNKEPKVLSLKNSKTSFEELVNKYSGGITARAILDELVRVGAVEKLDKDKVRLLHHGYVPERDSSELIEMVSRHTADLFSTGLHNISHEPHEARFQRQVVYSDIPEHVALEFQQLSHDKALALLLELNHWLSEKKARGKSDPQEATTRVGMGLYFFRNDNK